MAPKSKAEEAQLEQQQPGQQNLIDDDDNEDLPPAYSMASPSTTVSSTLPETRGDSFGRFVPGLPPVPFSAYVPSNTKVSTDLSTTTVVDSKLCSSPQALAKFVQEQLLIPPMPEIRIKGTHKGWNGEEKDFDIRLNMMRYFLPRDGEKGLNYANLVSAGSSKRKFEGATGVEQWAQAFCADQSADKSFVITRKLTNWDSEFISGRIHGLLHGLKYQGAVQLTFPLAHTRTIIKSSSTFGSTLRSAFTNSQSQNKYEVESVWPYATHAPGEDDPEETGTSSRKCLVRSEVGWFKDWRAVLRHAFLGKKEGWVGLDDWMELAMKMPEVHSEPQPWGKQSY